MRRSALLLMLLVASPLFAQQQAWEDGLRDHWLGVEAAFRDSTRSPLPPEHQAAFDGLERFPPDAAMVVNAKVEPVKGDAFAMPTTTERLPMYRKVAVLTFKLQGRSMRLSVYQNIDLVAKPGYEDHLFVPFTDATNGHSTYGGGRYLDLKGPLGREVVLDFNKAYNPYCAYGGRYSCPIPPKENHLPVPVEAGVKKFFADR